MSRSAAGKKALDEAQLEAAIQPPEYPSPPPASPIPPKAAPEVTSLPTPAEAVKTEQPLSPADSSLKPVAKPLPVQDLSDALVSKAPAQPAISSKPSPKPEDSTDIFANSGVMAVQSNAADSTVPTPSPAPVDRETVTSPAAPATPADTRNDDLGKLREIAETENLAVAAAPLEQASGWPGAEMELEPQHAPEHVAVLQTNDKLPGIDQPVASLLCAPHTNTDMTSNIPSEASPNREQLPSYLEADEVVNRRNQSIDLKGDAVIIRGDQSLRGDEIHYDPNTERADATGNVKFREAGMAMNSQKGYMVLKYDQGQFDNADLYMPGRNARTTAEQIDVSARHLINAQTTTYTTCNYGNDDWMLHTGDLDINRATGQGVAWNSWIEFMGVPFVYSPYLSFPIDDRRKSGLLPPSYGTSELNGVEIKVPFYWNIATNMDATITPRFIEQRGLLIDNEFRYLNKNSEGALDLSFISGDNIYEGDRGFFHFEHDTSINDSLKLEIDASHVSDRFFLKDFSSELYLSSLTNLTREAKLSYTPGSYSVTARVLENFLVDNRTPQANRPYRLLPEVTASTAFSDEDLGLDYDLLGRFTYFQNSQRVESQRLELKPAVRMPFANSFSSITPKIELLHTSWFLQNNPVGMSNFESLTVPTFSVDSTLYIDKEFRFDDTDLIHSIEPRLFYLYVPEVNQNGLPLFDSSETGISYSSLFTTNRFGGGDRVGDAHAMTAGVTTRLTEADTNTEWLALSIGEQFFFEDKDVTTGGAQSDRDRAPNSLLVGELRAQFPFHLTMSNDFSWDHKNSQTPTNQWELAYQPGADKLLKYDYRYTRNSIRESNIAFRWPLGASWDVLGHVVYSHQDRQTNKAFYGVQYESCCWIARLGSETTQSQGGTSSTSTTNNLESDTTVMFQIELKGLTGFGNSVKDIFGAEVGGSY